MVDHATKRTFGWYPNMRFIYNQIGIYATQPKRVRNGPRYCVLSFSFELGTSEQTTSG
jgi:hypothetical protein